AGGEGFGLPTLQAAAAGVVPVAVDYAASRELVLDHGEAVPARHFLPSEFGVRAALIDIDAAVARLEALYADRAALARKGAAAARLEEEAARHPDPLTIPATPPSANPDLAPHRTAGRILIGGPGDVPVVRRLARIFPGLNVWAAMPVELDPTGTGDAAPVAVWQP